MPSEAWTPALQRLLQLEGSRREHCGGSETFHRIERVNCYRSNTADVVPPAGTSNVSFDSAVEYC